MERYLTAREAAEAAGVSERTLDYLRSKRQGPPVTRIGARMVRYSETALREWLARRTEQHSEKDAEAVPPDGLPPSSAVIPRVRPCSAGRGGAP